MSDTTETIAQGDAQERAYQAALRYASDLGAQHGKSAASWVEIPDERTARLILAGMEDCDPAILDTLPSADLSGQWADMLNGPALVSDALSEAGMDDDADAWPDAYSDWFNDICDAYELAFDNAAKDEVSRRARF